MLAAVVFYFTLFLTIVVLPALLILIFLLFIDHERRLWQRINPAVTPIAKRLWNHPAARRLRERLATAQVDSGGSEFALTRVGRIADGWMTHSVGPHGFKRSWEFILRVGRESGRDMSSFDNVLYHHINVNADKQDALADSKRFLDLYYSADYTQARLESWLTYGSPRECVEQIKGYKASGCRRITFRISTMGDQMAQFRRVIEDVLPYVD